nr:MAG TPA: hypothetical protein [Caudoviricetes sp.]
MAKNVLFLALFYYIFAGKSTAGALNRNHHLQI